MSMELVIPSDHLILCGSLLLPSIFPSIRVYSNELALCIRWPKYWSFSFSINSSNQYSGLISFRTDWFDFLAVQGTLQSLLQHHNLKASILWHSVFFMAQLSHMYMIIGKKIIALTIHTFVSKMMSPLFNTLSRLVIAFFLRRKHLLILWLKSPSTVILEPKKMKHIIVSTFSLSICQEVMGWDVMILVFFFFNVKFKISFFTLLFYPHEELFGSSSISPIKVVITCISKIVGIFPGNLDFSL